MKTKLIITALTGLLALSLAPTASAQGGFNLSFGKHKRGKHFGVNINIPFGNRHHHPVHRHVHTSCCKQFIPGRVEVVHERVWVPGCAQQVWVPAVYRTQYDRCGNPVQVLVAPGHYETIQSGGHWETRPRRIQRPGRYVYTCGH